MKPEFKKIIDERDLSIDSCIYDESTMSDIEFFGEQLIQKCCEILNDSRFDNIRPSISIAQAMIKGHFEIKQ